MAKKKAKKPGMLVVASKVKAAAKAEGMRMGADSLAALSELVAEAVHLAAGLATQGRRVTIKDYDFEAMSVGLRT